MPMFVQCVESGSAKSSYPMQTEHGNNALTDLLNVHLHFAFYTISINFEL